MEFYHHVLSLKPSLKKKISWKSKKKIGLKISPKIWFFPEKIRNLRGKLKAIWNYEYRVIWVKKNYLSAKYIVLKPIFKTMVATHVAEHTSWGTKCNQHVLITSKKAHSCNYIFLVSHRRHITMPQHRVLTLVFMVMHLSLKRDNRDTRKGVQSVP